MQVRQGVDTEKASCMQVFVPSKDGKVKIPMFILSRKNVTLNGNNPTFLYAYGGQAFS